MRFTWMLAALLMMACGCARAEPWHPAEGASEIALWPVDLAIERPEVTGPERVRPPGLEGKAGRPVHMVENVSRPTMTIYPPLGDNSGAAVMVFPGGGYNVLAIDLEGTEVCDWLVARGITCVLLKYRVPGGGPNWNQACNCRQIPDVPMALQDAQRAIGLLRQQADELGVDPHRIGVIGFSAGGHLVAAVSNTANRAYARVDAADDLSSVPDFAMALYPGHLWAEQDLPKPQEGLNLAPDIHVSAETPPTFIVQAEDDPVDDVRHSLSYYLALRAVGAPVEMHLYAHGGHAFALRQTEEAVTEWPALAERWMQSIGVMPTGSTE